MVAPLYDDEYFRANGQSGDRAALWLYERMVSRMTPRGGKVVDFGCGPGFLSRRLSRHFRVTAVDASPHVQDRIQSIAPRAEFVTTLEALPSETYDTVVALHVLEHITDPAPTLLQFNRILKPAARALIVVPNPASWAAQTKGPSWVGLADASHVSLLDPDLWESLLTERGFGRVRLASDGLWDGPYLGKLLPRLQKVIFGTTALSTVLFGAAWLPQGLGESLVIEAELQRHVSEGV